MTGLPQPFVDEDGFPLCLRRVRGWVEARGGRVEGTGEHPYTWWLTGPAADLPVIRVSFDDYDGDVTLNMGRDFPRDRPAVLLASPDAYRAPLDQQLTALEIAVEAMLIGGFVEFALTDGDSTARGWILRDRVHLLNHLPVVRPDGDAPGAWRYEWSTYPAWPAVGG